MSQRLVGNHYGHGAGRIRLRAEPHRPEPGRARLRDGARDILRELGRGGPWAVTRRILIASPAIALILLLFASFIATTLLRDYSDDAEVEMAMFVDPAELLAAVEPEPIPETEVLPEPEPIPEPEPEIAQVEPPPQARPEPPKPPQLAKLEPPKPRPEPARVRPAPVEPKPRPRVLPQMAAAALPEAPAPTPTRTRTERQQPQREEARRPIPVAAPAAVDRTAPAPPPPGFRTARVAPTTTLAERGRPTLAAAPAAPRLDASPPAPSLDRSPRRPQPTSNERRPAPQVAFAAAAPPPRNAPPPPRTPRRASGPTPPPSTDRRRSAGSLSAPGFDAPTGPRPNRSPTPVRTQRNLAPTQQASAQTRPGVSGVPLGSLAVCRTDREEDRLKQQVIAAVTTQKECVSRAGTYRFVEAKNLNAFLMWIDRAAGRKPADRCVELQHALDCLKGARL